MNQLIRSALINLLENYELSYLIVELAEVCRLKSIEAEENGDASEAQSWLEDYVILKNLVNEDILNN